MLAVSPIPATLRAQYEGPADQGQQYPQAQQEVPDQGSPAEEQVGDPQGSVARLSILQGDVNVKRGDSGDLVAAAINAPLLTQDHLQTSGGSRAEVQLDSANMIRLAPNTDLGFADLEYHRYQVQLGAGSIIYRVLRDSNAQAEVDSKRRSATHSAGKLSDLRAGRRLNADQCAVVRHNHVCGWNLGGNALIAMM
jgi:hypothetical protein